MRSIDENLKPFIHQYIPEGRKFISSFRGIYSPCSLSEVIKRALPYIEQALDDKIITVQISKKLTLRKTRR